MNVFHDDDYTTLGRMTNDENEDLGGNIEMALVEEVEEVEEVEKVEEVEPTLLLIDDAAMDEDRKPVHSIVLDAAPLLTNSPSISSLLKTSEQLFTTPSVISEIRDPVARSRLETVVVPFLTVRIPSASSIQIIADFARKSGDLAVLSRTDLEVLALSYELECERNRGDWRLRRTPGQKELNGSPPKQEQDTQGQNVKGATLVKIPEPQKPEDDVDLEQNGPASLKDQDQANLTVRQDSDAISGEEEHGMGHGISHHEESEQVDNDTQPHTEQISYAQIAR
ncbi:MAG: hypothetical protein LQ340_004115, partial [Diploschistes diacapsis]